MEASTEATGWRPEEGESISGVVADLQRGWSDQSGSYYPIVVIKKESGELVNVHAFHTVLQNRLTDIRPKPGDRLTITYKGKKPLKSDSSREVAVYAIDAPDRVIDAGAFWQGVGADSPGRDATSGASTGAASGPDIEEDIPF